MHQLDFHALKINLLLGLACACIQSPLYSVTWLKNNNCSGEDIFI